MQIDYNGVNVLFNKEAVLIKLEGWEYCEDEFQFWNECGCDVADIELSEDEFIVQRELLISFVEAIDEESLAALCRRSLSLTAKGLVPKRRNIVFHEGIITGYSNEYGSHKYEHYALMAIRRGDKDVKIQMSNYTEQSSF